MNLITKKNKSILSLVISLILVWSVCISQVFAQEIVTKDDVKVIQNDKNICKVMAEYKGDKIYATLDKKTREVTMQTVEKSSTTLLQTDTVQNSKLGTKSKIKNYKVQVLNTKEGEKISAIFTDTDTNKKYKIGDSDKVVAQAPFAIPLVEILGSALIEALYAAAAAVAILGTTYIIASEVMDQVEDTPYSYFKAYIDYKKKNVMIGPAIDYSTALFRASMDSNPTTDVFCKDQMLAYSLAQEAGGGAVPVGSEIHGQEGYYWHYHPWTNSNHIFFYN